MVKECQYGRCERPGFDPWVGTIPWRRAWQPTLVFLPGESHGLWTEEPGGLQSMGSQKRWACLSDWVSPPISYTSLHYVYSLPLEPPSHASRSSQSTKLSSLCYAFLFFMVLGCLGWWLVGISRLRTFSQGFLLIWRRCTPEPIIGDVFSGWCELQNRCPGLIRSRSCDSETLSLLCLSFPFTKKAWLPRLAPGVLWSQCKVGDRH